ncbi:MAG: hypothetical protein AAF926_01885, partial [Pseudomonadota bacterium]
MKHMLQSLKQWLLWVFRTLLRGLIAALPFIAGWLIGAFVTTGLAVMIQTQNVLARLGAIGAQISLADRLSMTFYDLIHLGSLFVIFILAGTLIAYLVGLLVFRLAGFGRSFIMIVAGAVMMIVMLLAMKQAFFGVHLIAGARNAPELMMQMVAGAVGGFV